MEFCSHCVVVVIVNTGSLSSIIDILNQFSECHERDMVVIYVIKEMSKTIRKKINKKSIKRNAKQTKSNQIKITKKKRTRLLTIMKKVS